MGGSRRSAFASRVLIVVAASGAAAATAHSAGPQRPPQKPTFRSGVDVVLIDVNVVDRAHLPIADLKPDDFVVNVDRKPRKVVSAAFLRYDVRTTAVTDKAGVVVAPPSAASTRPPSKPPARNVLIAIDTDSMEPGDGMMVRREAEKFIDRLAPDDRIGVATIPRLRASVTMTKDRGEVRKQIAEVITGSERYRPQFVIGLAEAFDVERGDSIAAQKVLARNCCGLGRENDWPCDEHPKGCFDDVRMEIRQVQLQAHIRGERSLDALYDLGQSLSHVEGPKTMLLITGGVPPPDIRSGTAYSRIGTAMAAGQVTLYTLYVERAVFGRATSDFLTTYGPTATVSPTAQDDVNLDRDGVANATSAAGGTFMEAIGTLNQYFDRVVTELSGSYLLGVEVTPADRDGRPHQVRVTVNRKDVEVRARNEYLIQPDDARRADAGGASATAVVPRSSNPAAGAAATAADLEPLLERAGAYVEAYQKQFLGILAEERTDLKLSKWAAQAAGTGAWVIDKQRAIAADYLLVKRPAAAGWSVFHDVFEVDGKPTRARDGRLRALFLQAPDDIFDAAEFLRKENTAYDIGFVDRSTNVPAAPLTFLLGENRGRFVFARQADSGGADPTALLRVAFAERGSPTFLQGASGDAPADGIFWIDPQQGRVVKSVTRWDVDGSRVEIIVTYTAANDGSGLWVPTEMTEVYTTPTTMLRSVTKYSNFRKFESGG